jgi:hypothetical protein
MGRHPAKNLVGTYGTGMLRCSNCIRSSGLTYCGDYVSRHPGSGFRDPP